MGRPVGAAWGGFGGSAERLPWGLCPLRPAGAALQAAPPPCRGRLRARLGGGGGLGFGAGLGGGGLAAAEVYGVHFQGCQLGGSGGYLFRDLSHGGRGCLLMGCQVGQGAYCYVYAYGGGGVGGHEYQGGEAEVAEAFGQVAAGQQGQEYEPEGGLYAQA